jgi:hypothetical protein
MRTYLMNLGFEIWSVVNNDYIALTTTPVDVARQRHNENNPRAMNEILCGMEY